MLIWLCLLIAPDGHTQAIRDLPSREACLTVAQAYKSEVRGGKASCVVYRR